MTWQQVQKRPRRQPLTSVRSDPDTDVCVMRVKSLAMHLSWIAEDRAPAAQLVRETSVLLGLGVPPQRMKTDK